ncbi:MAG: sigma-70 family RNA polymerase sigma factor [Actinomycetota bacterium]
MAGAIVTARQDIEVLYREHGNRLWWALVAFSGDREVASDAEAEAFAQALRRGDDIRDPLAWIWKAAFRIAAGDLQQRSRFAPVVAEPSYELPEPAAEVAGALLQLPARQRAAVVLYYYADRPVREIAQLLETSPSTVSVHLHRGRNRLRDLLGDDDD